MNLHQADRVEPDLDQRTYVQFIIDERTGQITVNFIDSTNGEVLKQIPPNQLQGIIEDYLASRRVNDRVAQD
jgi:uncharacterized FlaG/YvyC family protein